MSIKIKISILAICFALLAAVCVGFAFAAPNEKLNLKGTLSYEVPRPVVMVSPNDPDLGSTTGSGDYTIGETVTLTATPSSSSNSSFLAWATSTNPNEMEIVSTSPTYSFEFLESTPKDYYALFNQTTSPSQTVEDLIYTFYNEAKLAIVMGPTSTSLSGALEIPSVVSSGENLYKVYSIGNDTFQFCSNLTSITIPEGVTSIGSFAFLYCDSLTSITLPSTVTSIGNDAFLFCISLEAFYGTGNSYFTIDDNRALIVDGGETLIAYAIGNSAASYSIPKGVTSIGIYAFVYCISLTSITIPEGVTSIGSYAFDGCSSLTSITLPSTLTSIGEGAFRYCSNLTSIKIPERVTSIGDSAFNYCSSLTSITLPSTLTSIGNDAFRGCSSLTSITIPEGVSEIGSSAFDSCYALAIVYNNSSLTIDGSSSCGYLGQYAKEIVNNGEQPQGRIEDIGNVNYYINETTGEYVVLAPSIPRDSLTEVALLDSTTEISQQAFSECSSLTSITLPSTVTSIGQSAFSYCSGLTSITLPSTVTSIGNDTFRSCSNLTSITIPAGVTSIGDYAFDSCYALAIVYNNSSLTIDGSSNCGYLGQYAKEVITNGKAQGRIEESGNVNYYINETTGEYIALAPSISRDLVTQITIAAGAKEINQYAFSDCWALETVIFEENSQLTSIGDYAFYGCSSLEAFYGPGNAYYTIDDNKALIIDSGKTFLAYAVANPATSYSIPEGVTSIENDAFQGCSNLTSITIPEGVTSIGNNAFYNCSGLTSISLPSTLTSIGDYAFQNCTNLTSITIPEGVTSIGNYAFEACISLTSISIPEGVTSIGYSAFRDCSNLTEISINGNISLDSYAFSGCSNLTKLTLGSNVTSIPDSLFGGSYYNLTNLTEIVVEAGSSLSAALPTYGTWVKDGGSETVTSFTGAGTYTKQ